MNACDDYQVLALTQVLVQVARVLAELSERPALSILAFTRGLALRLLGGGQLMHVKDEQLDRLSVVGEESRHSLVRTPRVVVARSHDEGARQRALDVLRVAHGEVRHRLVLHHG